MAYDLEGRLLEVCNCMAICPCWVGEDPDNGTCEGVICWHIDKGTINGTEVSGLTFAVVVDIPGNVLKGNVLTRFLQRVKEAVKRATRCLRCRPAAPRAEHSAPLQSPPHVQAQATAPVPSPPHAQA